MILISWIFTFLITAFIWLYLHVTRNFNHWKDKNVPYVKPIPFFGNAFKVLALMKSIGQFTKDLYNSTGAPFVGFFVFDQPFLLIRDPDLIKSCLVKDSDYFEERSIIENHRDDEIGSSILFVIKNPAWKFLKAKLTPVFSTGKIKAMIPLVEQIGNNLVDYMNALIVNEKSTNAREVAMKYTTDVIVSCAFGLDGNSLKDDNAPFRKVSRRIFDYNFSRATQMSCYFVAPMLVKLFKMKFLDSVASNFMREIFWKTFKARESSGSYRGDLIDALIQARKGSTDNGHLLDGDKLVGQAAMFFIAGFESSGSTISFTLYEISLNRSIQERLRLEIQSVLEKYGKLCYEVYQEMTYLDMVVSETLRKYPVLPHLDRRCSKPYKIPGTDVIIEKGVPVYMSLFGLHFDPKYFPNPEKYDPDRFSPENKRTIPPFTYLPFGDGVHSCIGTRFAFLNTKTGLIKILSNFKVELSEDTKVPLELDCKGILLAPKHELRLRFKPLNNL